MRTRPMVAESVVGTSYFQTLGIKVLVGRPFDDSDRHSRAPTVILNQAFATQHWPDESAGKAFAAVSTESDASPWRDVVGVVSNVVQNGRTRQAFMLAGASSALTLSAILGCWMPARRATRIDPVVVLRRE